MFPSTVLKLSLPAVTSTTIPASVVLAVKNLMLGNLQKRILLYVPDVNIESMNAMFDRANKEYAVFISYTYLSNPQTEELITFV